MSMRPYLHFVALIFFDLVDEIPTDIEQRHNESKKYGKDEHRSVYGASNRKLLVLFFCQFGALWWYTCLCGE